jgi:hypothetical protein
MNDWRSDLKKLAQLEDTSDFPLLIYEVNPPSSTKWPDSLPSSPAIREFYEFCNGGFIESYNWFRIEDVADETTRWVNALVNYYGDGKGVIVRGRHIVVAEDSAGAPLVWDSKTDLMATFWFKGGGWEPANQNFERFVEHLFSPTNETDLWYQALEQLRNKSL